jgi:hypothetical protein
LPDAATSGWLRDRRRPEGAGPEKIMALGCARAGPAVPDAGSVALVTPVPVQVKK